jgi:hypothetical protein
LIAALSPRVKRGKRAAGMQVKFSLRQADLESEAG